MNRLTGVVVLALFAALLLLPSRVYASEARTERSDSSGAWDDYHMGELEDGLSELFPEYHLDVKGIFSLVFQGKLGEAFDLAVSGVKGRIGASIGSLRNIFVSILILGILSALFSNFSDVFASHQIADVSFYFLYLFLITVLTRAFVMAADIASQTIGNIVLFIRMFIPAYFMAVGVASGTATATVSYQLMLLAAYGVERLLSGVLLPLIHGYMLLSLINGVWAEEKLSLLLDVVKKGIGVSLKLCLGAVTGISLLQAMITPVLDSLKNSALQKAVASIPGIGGMAEGVAQMVLGSAVLIKNSIGLLLLILLLCVCILPLTKLLLIACMIKGSAALSGIVSDKRVAGCADRVGDASFLLVKTAGASVALFLIIIAIVAYTTNRGM